MQKKMSEFHSNLSEKDSEFEAIVKMKLLSLVEEYQVRKEKKYEKLIRKN
jgi:hypothetical protein